MPLACAEERLGWDTGAAILDNTATSSGEPPTPQPHSAVVKQSSKLYLYQFVNILRLIIIIVAQKYSHKFIVV